MREDMKLNPEMVKLIGETQTQRLADGLDEVNKMFLDGLLAQYDKTVKEARIKFGEMLENPEFDAKHRDAILQGMRQSVIDQLGCSLLALASESYAEVSSSYADYTAHAVGHFESALQAKAKSRVLGSLGGVLMGLVPPDVLERIDAKNAGERADKTSPIR